MIQPPRRVLYPKCAKLQETLKHLEAQGVIARVDQAMDWVSNLVVKEKKNRKVRICLDPRPLNTAIKRQTYIMHTPVTLLFCQHVVHESWTHTT